MTDAIRVLIVDDQTLLREGFRRLLELAGPTIQVVGTAGDGVAALALIAQLAQGSTPPDVVLMDVRMPRMTGIEATAQLRQQWPDVRVLMLTTFDDEEYIVQGLRAGARGYLLKDVTSEELVAAIQAVQRGESPIQPSVAAKLVQRMARDADAAPTPSMPPPASGPRAMDQVIFDELTDREREILQHLAHGASNREISERLFITEGTVKNHVSNILNKLGLRDRTQAALYAREHGLG
jgi:DNA-binding NarL/FixJ family response regulator